MVQRVYQGLEEVEEQLRRQLFFRLLKAMNVAFDKQIETLKKLEEYDRYIKVEKRIREINLE
ncbi:MAG: hypothetical protein EOP49_53720, partial [Sphingobacteriales bacterium]